MQTDDDNDVVPIGFAFDFYGTSYTDVSINSNGSLVFGGTYLTYSNTCLPRTATPNQFVGVFWDDLYPPSGGTIQYQTLGVAPNRVFVVRWNINHIGASTSLSDIVAVLHESGDVDVCYADTTFGVATYDAGASATIGINGGTDSLQFSCNTASVPDGTLISYIHP